MFTLHNGDCLTVLPSIPSGSIDAIITDLPYGTTACTWDEVIPFADMWKEVKRVLKSDGVFVTTASQPFTSALVMSNPSWFKYEWIWQKEQGTGFQLAKYRPMIEHENIVVFCKGTSKYFPQMVSLKKPNIQKRNSNNGDSETSPLKFSDKRVSVYTQSYPTSIRPFARDKGQHPTQKPVALYRYLIRTYTNPNETVLDITMGSGTTGVACVQEGREFIGIEKEKKYFELARSRIEQAPTPLFIESLRQPTPPAPDGGDSPRQQALFSPEADSAIGDEPTPAPRR